ncbi:MAG: hypothetical protein Q7U04_03480 [Bacteriovorax sp.]|nr:hypothetical protein [Bacteriovorax sp.]
MKFLVVFSLLAHFGCLEVHAKAPDWFSDYLKTYPGCEQELLCAAGEGETLADALTNSRLEIAKFFQNKIKSKSLISTSFEQKGTNIGNASFEEWANKTISEETSELISGLEIKKQEVSGTKTYVLMTLNRKTTADLLKEKIEELDIENVQLFNLNSRFAYPKLMKNLVMIQNFLERYSLLSENPMKLKIKKENVQEKINKLKPIKVGLVTTKKQLPIKLNHILVEIFSSLKVIIVPQKLSPKYSLKSEIQIGEEYFKVEGFKKINVQFRLELHNSKSELMGKLSALSEQVARNSDQAIEKSLPDIKDALLENLDQLTNIKFVD